MEKCSCKDFCNTQRITIFMKTSNLFFFLESGCSYFFIFWWNLISTKSIFLANHESKKRHLFIGTKSNNKITYNQSLHIDFCEKYKIPKKNCNYFTPLRQPQNLTIHAGVFESSIVHRQGTDLAPFSFYNLTDLH